jgi:DNA repair exonuclease SbcCD nuclease subunit
MARFIHTADWQLGLRVRFIPGDAGAVVRDARLRTVRRIGQLAKDEQADFVVVAGDVFEHHGLSPATLRKTFDALADYPCPVYLLPGNHDPLTPDSLYQSPLWAKEAPAQLHVLAGTEPVEAPGGAWLFPCPLLERHTLDDPTDHLAPDFGPQGVVRVGVAHGGIREILAPMMDGEDDLANAIRIDAAKAGALDYLALGDWHGVLQVDARTWYSGAPEATRFKEKRPGNVLLVDIDGPGATPTVEERDVATQRWVQHRLSVGAADDLPAIDAFFDALPDKQDTLVELFLEGTVDAATHAALDALLARQGDRLCWLRRRDDSLAVLLHDADLDAIATDGWVRQVIDDLRPKAEVDDAARGALHLLYRIHQEGAR